MHAQKVDAIVVGSGIAGLGTAALLASQGLRVTVCEREPQVGGRMRSFPYGDGWRIDIGLHMTELGPFSATHEMVERVGGSIAWPPFSETVQFFDGSGWKSVADLVPLSESDQLTFRDLLRSIATLSDADIEAQDDRSWQAWMTEQGLPDAVRRLLATLSMIMTTLPSPLEQAAGEVLFICRENLQKRRQVLSANYPLGGMQAVMDPLASAVRSSGGEILLGSAVQEVILENGRVKGVRIPRRDADSPYPPAFRVDDTETLHADVVVCALPTFDLPGILDMHPARTALPSWWVHRIREISSEVTGLFGYIVGLSEPVTDKRCFFGALELPHTGLPFQAFPASTYDPATAPEGKQLLHTDCVMEPSDVKDPFTLREKLQALWKDLSILFPGIEAKTEFRVPFKTACCDGIARKPGLVGRFKPDVEAPGVDGLYFAGDTYRGRGLAMNGAARSAMMCAERILAR